MINLKNIEKSFGSLQVLKGVSLFVPAGTVTALVGPSGGGKSTLLRCINLLEMPQKGTIELKDEKLEIGPHKHVSKIQISKLRRKTGMVFQSFNLFPHRTALQNVMESLLTVLKWDYKRAENRGKELLDKVGLSHKLDAFPAQLSGGQQQRVAIARALAGQPEVLLCDEPTSALDPELAGEVVEVLANLAKEGMTMIMATHDLHLAAQVAQNVVFLEGGTILESNTPKEFFTHPKSARTIEFVASLSVAPDWVI